MRRELCTGLPEFCAAVFLSRPIGEQNLASLLIRDLLETQGILKVREAGTGSKRNADCTFFYFSPP